jgi:hypothetical protein
MTPTNIFKIKKGIVLMIFGIVLITQVGFQKKGNGKNAFENIEK